MIKKQNSPQEKELPMIVHLTAKLKHVRNLVKKSINNLTLRLNCLFEINLRRRRTRARAHTPTASIIAIK
jgi:hypothetical protein